jgi:hypothetical protein
MRSRRAREDPDRPGCCLLERRSVRVKLHRSATSLLSPGSRLRESNPRLRPTGSLLLR